MSAKKAPAVKFEPGPEVRYVLAYCPACPPWRELTASRSGAYLKAAAHVHLVHGDKKAAAEYRRRAGDTQ